MARFLRMLRSLRRDRTMLFAMPCPSCRFVLTTDDMALLPPLAGRLKEHIANEHSRGPARPGGRDASRG